VSAPLLPVSISSIAVDVVPSLNVSAEGASSTLPSSVNSTPADSAGGAGDGGETLTVPAA